MERAPETAPIRSRRTGTLCSSASRSTSTQAGRSAASRSSTPGAASSSEGRAATVAPPVRVLRPALESRRLADEDHLHRAGLAVAVLADDQLGEPLVLFRGVVDLVAVDEGHHVGVLLDRARLAEVRELRPVVAAAPLGVARELRQG